MARIEVLQVDIREGGQDATDKHEITKEECYEEMRTQAQKRFDLNRADLQRVIREVDFVQLGATAEYAQKPVCAEIIFAYWKYDGKPIRE